MIKNSKTFVIAALVLVAVIVYFFVTAPPPLEDKRLSGVLLPIEFVLRLANEENKIARRLYTKEVLQEGKKRGIKFDENWQEKDVIAGLLPAQFLRETASYLEKSPVRLGLYLGSEFPINQANLLEGLQVSKLKDIKNSDGDTFFKMHTEKTYVFMSPDIATVNSCVTCHNKHPESPKTDWNINDVMGATTWLYPYEKISLKDTLLLLSELRRGFGFSYQYFLDEVKQMPKSYSIGSKWPREGYFVPSEDEFMNELSRRASDSTLNKLLDSLAQKK